jgi:hypothetical protein
MEWFGLEEVGFGLTGIFLNGGSRSCLNGLMGGVAVWVCWVSSLGMLGDWCGYAGCAFWICWVRSFGLRVE